ncbi:MAG: hypothetical protein LBD23_09860 [Oscillospiraceae bacterium]|nr:hypothetical protein [Oscillospiraceae bacterium]
MYINEDVENLNADDLNIDDDISLVFIEYSATTGFTAERYVIYPNRLLYYSYGKRNEDIISNPACFERIENSKYTVLSDKDFEAIMSYADMINLDVSNSDRLMQQGNFRYFITHNYKYREFTRFELKEDFEFYIEGNEHMLDILEILEKYFVSSYRE